jgi:hypothetical protein
MTTPHPEQPAEGPDDPTTEPAEQEPSEDGNSIDNDPGGA